VKPDNRFNTTDIPTDVIPDGYGSGPVWLPPALDLTCEIDLVNLIGHDMRFIPVRVIFVIQISNDGDRKGKSQGNDVDDDKKQVLCQISQGDLKIIPEFDS